MLIYNKTENENIVLTSLKDKKDDDDTVIASKNFIDTGDCFISDAKVNKSRELDMYVKDGKLIVAKDDEDLSLKLGKTQDDIQDEKNAKARKEFMDDIESTQNISTLEDIINNKKAPIDIRQVAQKRLVEVTGTSESQDNPELDNAIKNPTI